MINFAKKSFFEYFYAIYEIYSISESFANYFFFTILVRFADMAQENDMFRFIFGFKIKYLRQQKSLSYHQLADLTGMSPSYIHEIEKGKKYPKADKIMSLATALEVDYDYLVSINASKKLQPIIDLVNSDLLKVFPLELFGINTAKLLELFANTPDKVNSFISTVTKIIRNYQLTAEEFYLTAMRSYQDLHDNYFEDIENAVRVFKESHKIKGTLPFTAKFLESILKKGYNIKVDRSKLKEEKALESIRSIYSVKEKTLHINQGLSEAQENFLLARELAFHHMELKERPKETRITKIDSFDQLLNNFKASYFSVALLMDELVLVEDIKAISGMNTWDDGKHLLSLLDKYNVTQEMLFQRMTNIFPKHFNIKDLFFLRMTSKADLNIYAMTKELHLSQLHSPYANALSEHYCRRWISIKILKRLRSTPGKSLNSIADAQISKYWKTPNEYLCLSLARPNHGKAKEGTSVTIGLILNEQVRTLFRFLNDPQLKVKDVNTTCERCSMPDCGSRVAPPLIIEKQD